VVRFKIFKMYEELEKLYFEYQKNNAENPLSELEFFKKSFVNCLDEMDTLRQVCTVEIF